jgi:hypothetical protein
MTGSLEAALLLSQIVYWSDRSTLKDGWFYKTYIEWEAELSLTQYQVSKAIKVLKEFGVETKLKKHNDIPMLHYRINPSVFLNRVMKFFDNPGVMKFFDNPILTETPKTTNTLSPSGDGVKSEPEKPKKERPRNPMYDAIKDVWGYTAQRNTLMAGMLKGTSTRKGWQEYNLETPIEPNELRAWAAAWKRANPGLTMIADLLKVQSSITRWQELAGKRPAEQPVEDEMPPYDPFENLRGGSE